MPKLKFTATWIAGALAPGEYFDSTLPDFGVRVQPNGNRAYFVRVREAGRRVRLTLGPAPRPGMSDAARKLTLTLAAARDAAGTKLQLHRDGAILRPPVITSALEADAADLRPATLTVKQLAAAFVAKQGGKVWAAGTLRNHRDYLERIVVPAFGHRLAASIERWEVRDLLDAYAAVGPVAANRAHSTVCRMFRWAAQRDYIKVNPLADLIKPGKGAASEKRRARVLDHAEIRYFWTQLELLERTSRSKRDRAQVGIWRLRLLTAQREITLRRLRWTWVNFEDGLIEIPADAMKRRDQPVPHVIPMAAGIRTVLEQRRALAHVSDVFVFGTRTGSGRMPGPARGLKLELPDFQGKDLRRTATTLMRKHGTIDRDVVKWVLNHKINDVTGIYDRYDMYDEKLAALEKLDAIVAAILNPDAKRDPSLLRFPASRAAS